MRLTGTPLTGQTDYRFVDTDAQRRRFRQPQAAPVRARVGQVAPDFEANAFVNGAFKNLKLSDNKGKWTVLCFYPGDFTFV